MRVNVLRSGGTHYSSDSDRPKMTLDLIKRVGGFARSYKWWILGMLAVTLATTGLSLLTPLILRNLIDQTIPARDIHRLAWLMAGMLAIPLLSGALNVLLRQLNARVGEGVVFDLRAKLFSHLQRMSLGFFTHTRVGELMSRLNNDVVGAQNAISKMFRSSSGHSSC